ncbi:MAG: hypothetical protein FJ109_02930 [Deltaproteobacteria bacterium]|nr:hypothetical protein [Deltaproteobacteria bacterium]
MLRSRASARRVFICLLATVVLSSAGCATAPEREGGPSSLFVRNAGPTPCELFVDRGYHRTVPAATRLLVRNLPAAPWRLELSCPEPRVRQVVDPRQEKEVAVPGTEAVEDRTALLAVRNSTPFDLDIYLDFVRLGAVPSGADSLFVEVPAGRATLTFAESGGIVRWTQDADLVSNALSTVEAAAPMAVLLVTNDGSEPVEVAVRDRSARLAPNEATRFDGLPAGPAILDIRYPATGQSLRSRVELDPGSENPVRLSGSSGNLSVENRLPEAVTLYLAGQEAARIEPGSSRQILGLAAGNTTLRAQGDSGRTIEQTFLIVPETTEAWILEEGQGQVMVRNHVGETLQLAADGRVMGEMAPLAALRFPLRAGRHVLQARCVLCGHVATFDVDVVGGTLAEVVLGPQPGRLVLRNRTAEMLAFHRNGRPLTRVGPGMTVELAGQPLGRHLVEVLAEDGTLVKREAVEIVPRDQGTAVVDVALTALAVLIRNNTGEPVKVFHELSPEPHEIPAAGEGTARLPGLSGVVRLRGTVTGNRYDRRVAGEPGALVLIELAALSTGAVVENRTAGAVELFLDGTPLASVEAGDSFVKDRIAPGRHRLEARIGEQRIDEVAFQLQGGGWYIWRLSEKLGVLQILNRTSEALAVLLDGASAGTLPAGGMTRIEGLPLRVTTVTARGDGGQLHAFTFTPATGVQAEWTIRSESGGVLVHGLAGTGGTVLVDGIEVARIATDAPDPKPIPLDIGTHVVRVDLPDGTHRVGTVTVSANLYMPFLARGSDPEIELRNRTSDRLLLSVDGLPAGEVAAGATAELLLSGPGSHSVHATSPDGTGSWRLENVPFKAGARFGWTVGE